MAGGSCAAIRVASSGAVGAASRYPRCGAASIVSPSSWSAPTAFQMALRLTACPAASCSPEWIPPSASAANTRCTRDSGARRRKVPRRAVQVSDLRHFGQHAAHTATADALDRGYRHREHGIDTTGELLEPGARERRVRGRRTSPVPRNPQALRPRWPVPACCRQRNGPRRGRSRSLRARWHANLHRRARRSSSAMAVAHTTAQRVPIHIMTLVW